MKTHGMAYGPAFFGRIGFACIRDRGTYYMCALASRGANSIAMKVNLYYQMQCAPSQLTAAYAVFTSELAPPK